MTFTIIIYASGNFGMLKAKSHKQSFRKPDVKQDLTATEKDYIDKKKKKRKTKASCVLYYGDSCVHTQFYFNAFTIN